MKSETSPIHHTYRIGLLLLEDFNSLAMQAFIDPFRSANYLKNSNLYEWSFLGFGQTQVKASNGLFINQIKDITKFTPDIDLLVVNASWGVEQHEHSSLLKWIRELSHKGTTLCGLDTGAFILAYAGLLADKKAAVHYEHIAAFRELFPNTIINEDMFTIDDECLTSCGGLASTDLALEIIRLQHGIELANAASRYIFHERLRSGHEGQLSETNEPVGYAAPEKLREAIILMEGNLEQTLTIGAIAKQVALSQRQLDRIFQKHTGNSPKRYYLDVRLDRARGLITQTALSILEVTVACGFSSNAQFSRTYKARFGLSPSRDRIEGRVPFQFRSFPSYAGV